MLSFLFSFFYLFPLTDVDEKITVYINENQTRFEQFEREIVTEILNLYNLTHKKKLSIHFRRVRYFSEVFTLMDSVDTTDQRDSVLAINCISITKVRKEKYDFSSSYLPNKLSLISAQKYSDKVIDSLLISGSVIGVLKHSVTEDAGVKIKMDFPNTRIVQFTENIARIDAMKNGTIHFIISDYVDTWAHRLYNARILEGEDQFGMLFPKHSQLKKELENVYNYFFKSKSYYYLIKNFFGEDAVLFFQHQSVFE